MGFICFLLVFAACNVGIADDWPTYRCSIRRSGISAEAIGPQLSQQWKYTPAHPPRPAWPMPAEELPRMHSDNACHVAAADGSVYFGSSVTNEIYSLDAASGKINWTFFAQGPIRFAPTFYNGRLYFGSDDGYAYCLNAEKGKLIWKYRPGPTDEKVIGNDRMISLWPLRTAVLLDDGTAYFAAGVFPYEGIYICALDAEDGSVIWKNDTIGEREHELDYGGISPHGYPLASKDILYIPSGRAMPAAFDRKTGEFLFYAVPGGKVGGTWTLLDNDKLIAGVDISGSPQKVAYDARTGQRKGDAFAWFPGIDMVATRRISYVLTGDGVYAIDRAAHSQAVEKAKELAKKRKELVEKLSKLRKKFAEPTENSEKINQQASRIVSRLNELAAEDERLKNSSYKWHYRKKGLSSLIIAGDYLFAGGKDIVVGINAQTGKEVWKCSVVGKAVGLAAANTRLIVSTDKGAIYCFAKEKLAQPKDIRTIINSSPYPKDKFTALYESAAEQIIKETQINKGYCLVLDCGKARLAYELAKRTELKIVAIEKNPKNLAAARKNLKAAGLLGARVVVEPWELSSLPNYFANLIVSDGMLISGKTAALKKEINRLLRPCGGVSLLGAGQFPNNKISWNKFVRPRMEEAGNWTHQYANPQNTACSNDKLLKGPLGILWFGEPGPKAMVERHAKPASPLSMNGRLFIQGEEVIMAYDAYNGTLLWQRKIPGAVRVRTDIDTSNLALTEDALYVAAYDKCYRLDPATGKTVRTYELPTSENGKRRWGYISCADNILYGSTAMPLKRPYAALWKKFTAHGKWKTIDEINSQFYEDNSGDEGLGGVIGHKAVYEKYTSSYPSPDENARAAMQRDGALWHPITDFPKWENYSSSKDAVTERIMVGDKVFAMDTETGKLLWTHNGKRIANITLSLGEGKIFFAESTVTEQQKKHAIENKQQLIEKGIYEQAQDQNIAYDDTDVRTVICLNAATGEKLWEKTIDLTGCCGDAMGTIYCDGLLLLCGNVGNHDAWRFKQDQLKFRRITALSAQNGNVLWSRPLNYRTRPLIVNNEIIIEPLACSLRTGNIKTRIHPTTGEQVPWEFLRPGHTCAITSASADVLFYRSSCTAFYDLAADNGVTLFGAIRPGCWLNMIPANGLLLAPEASSGCTCSYPLRCSFALVRKPERSQPWAVFITQGPTTPVKHFAINLGAPADMRDDQGTLWFGYPNPKTEYSKNHFPNYGVKFDLQEKVLPAPASPDARRGGGEGMGYFFRDHRGVNIEGTDKPWLFTSGCRGLLRCELPLIDDVNNPNPGLYTVQLGFNAPPGDKPGQRAFDIKLQDNIVLKNFDILKSAGKPNKAVIKEFNGISVKNTLTLELLPKTTNPKIDHAPLINFIKVIREATHSGKT